MALPHFLTSNTKSGGQARYTKDREAICLMEEQVKPIYKKVETEDIFYLESIKWEIEADKLDNINGNNSKINPYHERITNKVEKDDTIISQM